RAGLPRTPARTRAPRPPRLRVAGREGRLGDARGDLRPLRAGRQREAGHVMSAAVDVAEEPRDRRRSAVAWGVLLTAAIVVYELTTQPGLAGLTLALKAGLRDFRTAFWLRIRDPNAGRGTAHFWLFVCTGMGLTCLAALGLLVALVALVVRFRLR